MMSFGKLFLIIFLPVAAIFSASFYFNYKINTQNISDQLFYFMKNQWVVASALDIETPATEQTHQVLKNAVTGTEIRLTLIAPNGKVLNDSHVPYENIASMEDHSRRKEFRNANLEEPGYDIRPSASTGSPTVYYAKKLNTTQGVDAPVLRIAYEAVYLEKATNALFAQSIILMIAALLTIALIAAYLASKFSTPVKNLNALAKDIEKGVENRHFPQFDDPSFNKISEVLYKIYANLVKEKLAADRERQKLNEAFEALNEGIILIDKNNAIIHINHEATGLLATKLNVGENVVTENSDVDLIVFFRQMKDNLNKRFEIKYKDRLFEAYSKAIGMETLIVFAEISDKFQYEAFKTELIGNLTHEIKTPIALVMGASETILKDDSMAETTKYKFLETIHRNSIKLNDLVNDTLELHRLEYQNLVDDSFEPANVAQVIDELLTIFQNGKELQSNAPDILVNIKSYHLSSILTNLVTNAQKYSTGDKIFINVKKDKKRVTVTVADMGPLIPEHERKRIFERFYTVSKSRNKSISGTGLGLAIVKHIANLYSGNIIVYDNDFGGNTFEVTLKEI